VGLIVRFSLRCCVCLAVCFFCPLATHAQTPTPPWPGSVQTVRGDWNAANPPQDGWVGVGLPDDWRPRWPAFDGVVWYRLNWDIAGQAEDTGLFVDYLNLAGTISINGNELQRDANLVEPLSRMWNTPRYLLLPASMLHAGENEILIRVSGFADHQPALGQVAIGSPVAMQAIWKRAHWLRVDLQWLNLGIGTTLGTFFLALWLIRRRETAFGWYAAQQAAWFVFSYNFISISSWPFATTDAYSAAITASYLVYDACSAMFMLRIMGRHWPRVEAAMWFLTALVVLGMLLTPHARLGEMRNALSLFSMAMIIVTTAVFLYLAWWRHGNIPQRVLSLIALGVLMARAHDFLVFLRLIASNFYLVTYAETLSMVGFALTLAWTFATNIRRIESFNSELTSSVARAREELATTLERQHELELVHARLDERLTLAHDLHDGLGGILIGNIATFEEAPETVPTRTVLELLRELRDDLRLIIDTASSQTYGEDSLGELVALLRHRMTRLFEARRIAIRWHIEGVDRLRLASTQSMDVLRILQEALSNALKHSGATGVEVDLVLADRHLRMEVRDNGVGLPANGGTPGTGIRSMRMRARRLGALLIVDAEAGVTFIRLDIPVSPPVHAAG